MRFYRILKLKLFKGANSVGLMIWLLAREVLRIRGTISRSEQWSVMPDLFFYRDQEETNKDEQQAAPEVHETYESAPVVASGQEAEWNQDTTTIGQNVPLQPLYATNDEWSGPDDNWNRGAAVTESWANNQQTW